jgi:hypothetical protein
MSKIGSTWTDSRRTHPSRAPTTSEASGFLFSCRAHRLQECLPSTRYAPLYSKKLGGSVVKPRIRDLPADRGRTFSVPSPDIKPLTGKSV